MYVVFTRAVDAVADFVAESVFTASLIIPLILHQNIKHISSDYFFILMLGPIPLFTRGPTHVEHCSSITVQLYIVCDYVVAAFRRCTKRLRGLSMSIGFRL